MKRLFFLAALMALGCGGSDSPSGPTSAAGTWNLATMNGHTLPANINGYEEVLNGQLELRTDGTFDDSYQYHPAGSTATRTSDNSGTWSQSGSLVSLNSNGTYSGTLSGSHLTVTEFGGEVWVYSR